MADMTCSAMLGAGAGNLSTTTVSFICESFQNITGSLETVTNQITDATSAIDSTYLLFSAYLVFAMQLDSRCSVRDRGISYYLFGFAFAFAPPRTASSRPGSPPDRSPSDSVVAYLIYSSFLTGFVYPVVSHWFLVGRRLGQRRPPRKPSLREWKLSTSQDRGVHMVGGIAGLWGALIEGPRIGRFDHTGRSVALRGHSASLVVLGTFPPLVRMVTASTGVLPRHPQELRRPRVPERAVVRSGRTAVTTTLAGCAAGLTTLFGSASLGHWNRRSPAGCSVVEPWAAIVCGVVAACVLIGCNKLAEKYKYDDPLEAAQLHGGCGTWGLIFTGLFAKKRYVNESLPGPSRSALRAIIQVIVIAGWVSFTMGCLFLLLRKFHLLRISSEDEMAAWT
ncbi:unnamed protein product [Spirodela intermedia]|uniref:Ammonium transporter AmtB-like domain-containing protein n=1 Tax=Spirodela intermedia TaxID=51605 RepID=A0A7I8JAK8_SPIIN|nr:unnamed protein product [Spirodela intermedia]CAA6666483.1 unnamed protein product [Spirodela intermedia]